MAFVGKDSGFDLLVSVFRLARVETNIDSKRQRGRDP